MFTNKQLKSLIIPLVIEQFLSVLVGTMDVMMVAQVGEYATSGVSLVDQITILFMQVFAALATGGSVIAANYIGKKEPEQASEASIQLMVTSTAIGGVLMLISLFFHGALVDAIFGSIEADVRGAAVTYFWITSISFPFLALYNAGAALCRAQGDSRTTMRISLLVNFVNVAGNALLILGFKMGTAGVAIPTLVSRALGAVLITRVLLDEKRAIHIIRGRRYRFNWPIMKKVLQIGIPTGIDGSVFQVGKLLLASLVSTLGTASITANAVGGTLTSIVVVPCSAMGLAMVTIVGQCVGAGENEQAKYYTKKVMKWAYGAIMIMCSVISLGLPVILKLYNLSPETMKMAKTIVWSYCGAAVIMWPTAFAFQNALRAGGDATFIMVVSMSSMWLFRVACAYVLVKYVHVGVIGVWIGMYIDWVARCTCFLLRFRSGKWIRLSEKK